MDRTDGRDAQQKASAGQEEFIAARGLKVIDWPAPDTGEGSAAETAGCAADDRGAADHQIVVGSIPRQLSGFQPRPDLMARLTTRGPVVQIMTGGKGAGKTQLAATYARAKLAAGWRFVAWINAEDAASLLAGLHEVSDAARLSYGGTRRAVADAGQQLRQRLEADGDRCLLVFDDAEDPDLLRPYIPATGAARVLITGAGESLADLGAVVPVDAFRAKQAMAFLAEYTGLNDEAGAAAVAAELGHLPLAVAQAAAVIAAQRLGYGGYLEKLRAVTVAEHLPQATTPSYQHGVAEAVLVSLDAIRAVDKSGVCNRIMELYDGPLAGRGPPGVAARHRTGGRAGPGPAPGAGR